MPSRNAFIFLIALDFLCAPKAFGESDDVLYEIVKDAQATSRRPWKRGSITAMVENEYGNSGKIRAKIDAVWDGADAFLVAKIGDPDRVVFRDNPTTLEESLELKCLILGTTLYFYNPYLNQLQIRRNPRPGLMGVHEFIEVIPSTNWTRCCPPWTSTGQGWPEIMSKKSPMHEAGSQVTISLQNQDHVIYKRTDPSFGEFTCTCSLSLGGNITEYKFTTHSSDVGSDGGKLEWAKDESGDVVLKRRIHERYAPGRGGQRVFRSTLTVDFVRLSQTRSDLLSWESLKSQLPRNTFVNDHTTNKSYSLYNDSLPDEKLKGLSRLLKTQGFLEKK